MFVQMSRRTALGDSCTGGDTRSLLAYVTELVNQKLLLQNECLIAEKRIPLSHLRKRPRLTNPLRSTLGEIAKKAGPEGTVGGHRPRASGKSPRSLPPTRKVLAGIDFFTLEVLT